MKTFNINLYGFNWLIPLVNTINSYNDFNLFVSIVVSIILTHDCSLITQLVSAMATALA